MSRTPEEVATNDAIEAAIEAHRQAYKAANPDESIGTLVDWIVVAAEIVPGDTPDDDETAYSIIMPSGGIPTYRATGLLSMGKRYVMYGADGD